MLCLSKIKCDADVKLGGKVNEDMNKLRMNEAALHLQSLAS